MSKELIPGFDEAGDSRAQLVYGEELIVFEAFAFENAKPRGMERDEVDDDAFVLRLEPLPSLVGGRKRCVYYAAKFGNGLTEIVTAVGNQIIHNIVKVRVRRMALDMGPEELA